MVILCFAKGYFTGEYFTKNNICWYTTSVKITIISSKNVAVWRNHSILETKACLTKITTVQNLLTFEESYHWLKENACEIFRNSCWWNKDTALFTVELTGSDW